MMPCDGEKLIVCTSLKKVVTQEQTEVTMKRKTRIERVYNEDTG